MAEALPEGTDQIVPGAGSSNNRDEADGTARGKPRIDPADLKEKAGAKAAELKDQYADKARGYAEQGKARASAGLDSVARMIGDNAGHLDGTLGEAYGDYLRKAAGAVSDFSTSLRDRNVDELVDDARDLVRRSPAFAIGAAAAAGFVLARIIKAGSETLDETAKTVTPKTATKAGAARTGAAKAGTAKASTATGARRTPKRSAD